MPKSKAAQVAKSKVAQVAQPAPAAVITEPPFKNKQRVLVFSNRGINARQRHLLEDLRNLLPHSKKETKLDNKDRVNVINEIAEMRSCNNCIFFEMRRHEDLYMWVSKVPDGPSAKFLVQNIHTMDELKLTGNCLKGSRPFLSFDANFDSTPEWKLLKEVFLQVFGTPKGHSASKPFIDHVFSFTIADNRIWFRNYQIVDSTDPKAAAPTTLVEIGPRFTLQPIRIFSGSFGGSTLYENPVFVTPARQRAIANRKKAGRFVQRLESTEKARKHRAEHKLPKDEVAEVFQ